MPKPVRNIRKLHKMWSVRSAVVSALLALQEIVPLWEGVVPDNVFVILGAVASTGVILGRAIDQGLDT